VFEIVIDTVAVSESFCR